MRKILIAALTVFALAFAVGMISTTPAQALTVCWYACDCNGTPLKCCKSGNVTTCKVVKNSPLQCTQGANC